MPDQDASLVSFQMLNEADQKAAIDIGVVVALLGLRLPACGQGLYDYVATEFVAQYQLPKSLGKHALRDIGRALFEQDWEYTIKKEGNGLLTVFRNSKQTNGETA